MAELITEIKISDIDEFKKTIRLLESVTVKYPKTEKFILNGLRNIFPDSDNSRNMNKAIVLQFDDWECLYINEKLVDEGHTLNQGMERVIYFVELAQKHDFYLPEIKFVCANEQDEKEAEELGDSKNLLSEYSGYKNYIK